MSASTTATAGKGGKRMGMASAIYVGGALLAKVAKFLLVPFYVHYLTLAEVGIVVFLQAVSYALARVFPLGLGQAVKRYYVEFDDVFEADRFTAGIWWTVTAAAVGLAALLMGTAPIWGQVIGSQIATSLIVLAVADAALQGIGTIPLMRYIVRQEPMAHSAFSIVQIVSVTAAVVLFVAGFGWGVEGVIWGEIVGYGVWALASAVIVNAPARWRPTFGRLREAFRYSIVLLPHLVFVWGITFADRLILEAQVSLDALGVYGVGYQMATVLTMVSIAISNAWLARFFRTGEGEGGSAEYARTFSAISILTLFLALGLFVFADEIIAVVANREYAGAVLILRLVVVAHVFHAANQFFMLPLFLVKQTRHISTSTGLGLVVNVVANLLLIPALGIVGAAAATIAGYLAATLSSFAFARRGYPVRPEWRALAIAAAVATALAVAALALPLHGGSILAILAKLGLCVAFPLVLLLWPGRPVLDRADLSKLTRQLPGIGRRSG
ncbi:lipopolysaccharide biosynthesis protein [Rubrivirga marina]|uniref:lipopolysaccharide biosynthesis protein n=1 Tax=Rubrivirga marina TaxID=1196024 RepID=UPI0015C8DDDD|nr:polysaccharide biosynthesis C-terminal domain-containing protein [Rubrivirga marina]